LTVRTRQYVQCGSTTKARITYDRSYSSAKARVAGKTLVRATGSKPANTNSYAPSGYNCPTTAPIKGNESSMIYHPPSSPWYDATTPEQCFASEAGAVAAGFVRASY
jgi:hypothetical protein